MYEFFRDLDENLNDTEVNVYRLFPENCKDLQKYMRNQWSLLTACKGMKEEEVRTINVQELKQKMCALTDENIQSKTVAVLRDILNKSDRPSYSRARKAVLLEQVLTL